MLGAERNDELLVGVLLARLVQDAHVRLAAVERLGSLTEAAGETVVHERELEDALERVEDRHLALGGGVGRDLDLIGHGGGGGVLFYVRLSREKVSSRSAEGPGRRARGDVRVSAAGALTILMVLVSRNCRPSSKSNWC